MSNLTTLSTDVTDTDVLTDFVRSDGVRTFSPTAEIDPDAGLYAMTDDEFDTHLHDLARDAADERIERLAQAEHEATCPTCQVDEIVFLGQLTGIPA